MIKRISLLGPNPLLLSLLAAGTVALLLQLPISRIAQLVRERQGRLIEAVAEVTEKSGQAQTLNGPALVVPFTQTLGSPTPAAGLYSLTLLPQSLIISGTVEVVERQRGIFRIPVYSLEAQVSGRFSSEDLSGTEADPASIDWSRAKLVMGISGVRSLQAMSRLQWGGREIDFLPGIDTGMVAHQGIHAPLALSGLGREVEFSFPLSLSGSQGLYFMPNGRESAVEIRGNSGFASFQGHWLPLHRELSEHAFQASWSIPYLARNYPQAWVQPGANAAPPMLELEQESSFGVDLLTPVDAYRMTERSVKYAGLFILLTFALVWLVAMLAGVRIHPIQYILLGAAMCIFYLLELSLAEHLEFARAYLLASLAIVGLCSAYGLSLLGRPRRAALLGAALSTLYGYLYVVLTNEDQALLVGSLGLLVALALVMFATKKVDWYAGGRAMGDGPKDEKLEVEGSDADASGRDPTTKH